MAVMEVDLRGAAKKCKPPEELGFSLSLSLSLTGLVYPALSLSLSN